MSASGLSIEMLPARHGDALWLEWGEPTDRHRMLIDAGPAAAYPDVRVRIEQVDPAERQLDLMIVTHIDLDHIGGAIELLEDSSLGVTYDDIWFNDLRHLPGVKPKRGALQGEYLARLLTDHDMRWNTAFDEGPVRVEPKRALPRVPLKGGLTLVVLSPTPDKLATLRREWENTLAEAEQKADARAVEEGQGTAALRGDRILFGGDGSAANGSSIAVVCEYHDERWLLAGDAHADVLLDGLTRYGKELGEFPVRLDGFKLPHHGSARNITQELLAAMRCGRFLVSTNGAYFKHPDHACLELITRCVDRPELIFNSRTKFTEPWAVPSESYRSAFPGSQPITAARSAPDDSPTEANLPPWAQQSAAPAPPIENATAEPHVASTPVAVKVVHGSVERSQHTVVVGHYLATPLSGAEGFVNRRYGDRLAQRLSADRYPGNIGESLLITAPKRKHPHAGVLVIGLGQYGELTPTKLVETVRAALVRHALDQADRRFGEGPVELGVSSVLLGGTGGQGLSISSSVRAVVDGVCAANRDLRTIQGGVRATYTELEFWERNAPEAELAFLSFNEHVLSAERDDSAGAAVFTPPTELVEADGSLSDSLPADVHDATWFRVRVTEHGDLRIGADGGDAPPELVLEFTVGGRMARTGTVIHRVERRRLARILQDAVASEQPITGLHTTLFELLFPNQLKWDLMAAQDIQLEVDDVTADIPWEMLAARNPEHGARGQLALRAALVRQLQLADHPAVHRSSKPTALVIGNPPVGSLAGPLDGAYAEAIAVRDELLAGGYEVTDLCFDSNERSLPGTTAAIETAVFAADYRMIHIAAHGCYQPDDPTRTGVAIGPDDFLTAALFRQLNVIPDVMFLNCCHLGAVSFGIESGAIEFTRRNLNRLGASLARELIDGGVRAVVVAGWAVNDQAASAFATSFYRSMLEGTTFGSAVHEARWAAFEAAPEHSTWGAYQCYGDGGYALPRRGGRQQLPETTAEPRTLREALRRLDKLINRIESVGVDPSDADDRSQTEGDLVAIEAAIDHHGWTTQGRLCEQLAEAWRTVGDADKAIAWYERAIVAEDGRVTIAGIEQLANLRDRRATAILRTLRVSKAERERASTLAQQSIESIGLLEQLSNTGERATLRGAHFKRRAIAVTGDERIAALAAAVAGYLAAYRQTKRPYPLLNFIQLETLRSRTADEPPALDEVADDFAHLLDHPDDRDYWTAIARPDCQLTRALCDDAIEVDRGRLVKLYNTVFDTRSTWGQRTSTLNHLLDLADLHPDNEQASALRALNTDLGGDP